VIAVDGAAHHPRHHLIPGHGILGFMERVQRLVDGDEQPNPLRTVVRAPRSLADATDEWVALRAMAEQIVSEANAVLPVGWEHLRLDDEAGRWAGSPASAAADPGALSLGFALHGPGGEVRVSMRSEGGLAWVGCDGSLAGLDDGSELAEPEVLEDVVLLLLTAPA
jgi:hypothetical protein